MNDADDGKSALHLSRRQVREDRSAVRRQMRRQSHAYIGDQGDGDAGGLRLLLEQVDTLGAVKDSEMRCLADGRDQPLEDWPGDVLEGLVAQIRRTDLECREPERVRTLIGKMHDEAALDQHLEQVIGRRARHSDVSD